MAFWHMQLHPDEPGWKREKELLEKMSLIGLGFTSDSQANSFKKDMKIGDIVLIRHGSNPKALVKVVGEVEDIGKNDHERLDWFRYRRKVKVLDFANENVEKFPYAQGTLKSAKDKTTQTYQYIDKWYRKILQKDYNKEKLIKGTYKLKELYIKDNKKTFQNFKIDFTSDGKEPLSLIVIAGKNGMGKTTILEYLANFEIQKDDYLEIFKVDDNLIVDNFYIKDGMQGIQSIKKEYRNHIKYMSVKVNDIGNIEEEIISYYDDLKDKYIESVENGESPVAPLKQIQNFIEKTFDDLDFNFNIKSIKKSEDGKKRVFLNNLKSNKEFGIDSLSTGEKTLFSKVLSLFFEKLRNKIILIDEPELSLHPAWQNKVLKLYENFANESNCQIILATHSPHIIGSAKNEYIRILTEDGVINDVVAYGRDIEWILKEVMGAGYTREMAILDKFKMIQDLINTKKIGEAEKELDKLEAVIGEHDSDIAKLRVDLSFERMELEEDSQNY